MKEIGCAFCEIPLIKQRTIIENKLAWAFPTNIPIVPGHTLIVPHRHVITFDELTDEELSAILELRKRLRPALKKAFSAQGFHYAWNEGKVAGQSVPHFHLHIIPRKTSDEGITKYEPRKFLYRPGSREVKPEDELISVAELIKRHL